MMDTAGSPILVVVTTIGRLRPLETLVSSLVPQLRHDDELVVVAQGDAERIANMLDRARSMTTATINVITSPRGASRGRNAGVAARTGDAADPILLFPNDTTWFGDGTVRAIRDTIGNELAAGLPVRVDGKARHTIPPPGSPLDARSVWTVIEMGLAIRLSLFDALGGFDTEIGTGSESPWQAGEVTDLLMRALTLRPELRNKFVWASHPDAWVGGVAERAGLSSAERRWKLRAYGRGIGHVYRSHPFPWWQRWGFVAAGLAIGIRRREEYPLLDGLPAFVGRLEGATGVVISPGRAHSAVSR